MQKKTEFPECFQHLLCEIRAHELGQQQSVSEQRSDFKINIF